MGKPIDLSSGRQGGDPDFHVLLFASKDMG